MYDLHSADNTTRYRGLACFWLQAAKLFLEISRVQTDDAAGVAAMASLFLWDSLYFLPETSNWLLVLGGFVIIGTCIFAFWHYTRQLGKCPCLGVVNLKLKRDHAAQPSAPASSQGHLAFRRFSRERTHGGK